MVMLLHVVMTVTNAPSHLEAMRRKETGSQDRKEGNFGMCRCFCNSVCYNAKLLILSYHTSSDISADKPEDSNRGGSRNSDRDFSGKGMSLYSSRMFEFHDNMLSLFNFVWCAPLLFQMMKTTLKGMNKNLCEAEVALRAVGGEWAIQG